MIICHAKPIEPIPAAMCHGARHHGALLNRKIFISTKGRHKSIAYLYHLENGRWSLVHRGMPMTIANAFLCKKHGVNNIRSLIRKKESLYWTMEGEEDIKEVMAFSISFATFKFKLEAYKLLALQTWPDWYLLPEKFFCKDRTHLWVVPDNIPREILPITEIRKKTAQDKFIMAANLRIRAINSAKEKMASPESWNSKQSTMAMWRTLARVKKTNFNVALIMDKIGPGVYEPWMQAEIARLDKESLELSEKFFKRYKSIEAKERLEEANKPIIGEYVYVR